jgi:pyridinium-3,5-biscarboxylic acid mononucleotide sulfurtransferase
MESKQKLSAINNFLDKISKSSQVVVAFSGGVDSALLSKIVFDRWGNKASAVTMDSPTLPRAELEEAKKIAKLIGIKHEIIKVNELDDPVFCSNPTNRCYYCKKIRYGSLLKTIDNLLKDRFVLVDGTNYDDLSDWRPGIKASKEFGIVSPFAESALGKDDIRSLARELHLTVYDKPSTACLASRIPYGEIITLAKIRQIEESELILKDFGLSQVRVRHHGEIARIEIPKEDFVTIMNNAEEIYRLLKTTGFEFVALDLHGFRSGSFNHSVK